ncbi:hypothetical protein CBR_g22478 [Chara braunii]|uniref:Uncharacterized protein n=1 Tax=Chara braunii TaxID=69332 RepID=A0A388L2S4_CHABU|nr:hypothetical protein CBR_g22478 [Chara braunii]|eukprot:GBG76599.1 hypothetical protein CBR_g22478 [Chara braunii]
MVIRGAAPWPGVFAPVRTSSGVQKGAEEARSVHAGGAHFGCPLAAARATVAAVVTAGGIAAAAIAGASAGGFVVGVPFFASDDVCEVLAVVVAVVGGADGPGAGGDVALLGCAVFGVGECYCCTARRSVGVAAVTAFGVVTGVAAGVDMAVAPVELAVLAVKGRCALLCGRTAPLPFAVAAAVVVLVLFVLFPTVVGECCCCAAGHDVGAAAVAAVGLATAFAAGADLAVVPVGQAALVDAVVGVSLPLSARSAILPAAAVVEICSLLRRGGHPEGRPSLHPGPESGSGTIAGAKILAGLCSLVVEGVILPPSVRTALLPAAVDAEVQGPLHPGGPS